MVKIYCFCISIEIQDIFLLSTVYFRSLTGPVAPAEWQGGLNFTYHLGPTLGVDQAVNLEVNNERLIKTIHNIVGVIPGSEEPGE